MSLPRVLEGGGEDGEALVSGGEGALEEGEGGGAGRLEGRGGHAAQGEAQCPGDRQQQHLGRIIPGQKSLFFGGILFPKIIKWIYPTV